VVKSRPYPGIFLNGLRRTEINLRITDTLAEIRNEHLRKHVLIIITELIRSKSIHICDISFLEACERKIDAPLVGYRSHFGKPRFRAQ
jgi:hypothetical protein